MRINLFLIKLIEGFIKLIGFAKDGIRLFLILSFIGLSMAGVLRICKVLIASFYEIYNR